MKEKATDKILTLIQMGRETKVSVSDLLGISRPTLDKRIINDSWKKGELKIIESL